jgi:energy-coupling factor transporter transmembrane protein EcfT
MKRRLRWLAAVLLLSVPFFVIVLFLLRDFVRERIVIPLIYVFWMAGMILNSVPHVVYLFGLVLLGALLAVGSLRYLLYASRLPTEPPKTTDEPTRYQFWDRRCRKVSSSAFFMTSLGIELRRFVLMVMAYQEHQDMWDLERQISNKEFDVPPVIYDLVSQRNLGEEISERSLWQAIRQWLFEPAEAQTAVDAPLQQRLDQIVKFMENRLEVKNDRRDS